MKKLLLFVVLFIVPFFTGFSNTEIKSGDSLAILNYRVWAYENPDVLKTRLGPYSYFNKKMVYLGVNDTFGNFYKVLTPDGKEAYVKPANVSADKTLTHQMIRGEIRAGTRKKSVNTKDLGNFGDFGKWEYWVGIIVWLAVLYFLWKYFYKIENWFYKLSDSMPQKRRKYNFLFIAILLGVILGGTIAFNSREGEWFLNEGIRLWASYPSFWDWIWWGLLLLFAVSMIAAVVDAFLKFRPGPAISFSFLMILLMAVYFFTGFVIGWIVALVAILISTIYLLGKSGGKSDFGGPGTIYRNGKTYDRVSENTYQER